MITSDLRVQSITILQISLEGNCDRWEQLYNVAIHMKFWTRASYIKECLVVHWWHSKSLDSYFTHTLMQFKVQFLTLISYWFVFLLISNKSLLRATMVLINNADDSAIYFAWNSPSFNNRYWYTWSATLVFRNPKIQGSSQWHRLGWQDNTFWSFHSLTSPCFVVHNP